MSHSQTIPQSSRCISHVAEVGGSGVPLAAGEFRTYVVSRITTGVVLLFALSVAVFILTHVVPEDPLETLLGEELGFGSSRMAKAAQYPDWVGRMARGDFGYSVTRGTAVRDIIFERLPSTLMLLPLTMILAAAVSIPLGFLAAARCGTLMDRVVGGAAVSGVGVPSISLAVMLLLVLSMWYGSPIGQLLWPSLVLAFLAGAVMIRIIRSSIVEVLDKEDIGPPRSSALPVKACLVRGLSNLLIWAPALFGGFLAGAIVVETVFAVPGIGRLVVSAALAKDYPVLQGIAVVAAGMAVIVLGFSLVAGLLVRRHECRAAARPASGQLASPPIPPMSIARKVSWVPLIVIGILLVVAVSAPIIATQDPVRVSIEDSLSSPGVGHLLGTDAVGRDVLSRLIYGARFSLAVALLSLIPVAVVGGGLGLLSGYVGGKFDMIITGALDNIPAFPLLFFAILVTTAFGLGLMSLVIAVTLVLWPRIARAAREGGGIPQGQGRFQPVQYYQPHHCAVDSSLRAVHPHGSNAELPGPRNPASYTVVGQHDGRTNATYPNCAVDRHIPRLGAYRGYGGDDSVTLQMVEDIGQVIARAMVPVPIEKRQTYRCTKS